MSEVCASTTTLWIGEEKRRLRRLVSMETVVLPREIVQRRYVKASNVTFSIFVR